MLEFGYSSKLMAEWAFFEKLRDIGRRAAESFLAAHRGDIGRRSSLDLDVLLEGA
jgi:NTE family protein